MLQTHPIAIDGVLAGATVRLDRGYRFSAANMRLTELHHDVFGLLDWNARW